MCYEPVHILVINFLMQKNEQLTTNLTFRLFILKDIENIVEL